MNRQPQPHADLVFRTASRPASGAVSELSPAIGTSWRRCLNDFQLDPSRVYQPHVLEAVRLHELIGERADLIDIAQAEMDSLYEQISGSGYALLLAGPCGVILHARFDPTSERGFQQAGLIVGAEWSEAREGTNGIGTCVTEGRPITIYQADHFRERHTGLSCSAAPIHDSMGNIVAVLDASSVDTRGTREQQMHTVALVNSSARSIEKCLFLRQHQHDTVLRFHYRPEFVDLLHDGALAIDANGQIIAADRAALRLLGAHEGVQLVGRAFSDVFDAPCDEMRAAVRTGQRAIGELCDLVHGRRYFASLATRSVLPRSRSIESRARSFSIAPAAADVAGSPLTLETLAGSDPLMLRHARTARRVADAGVSILINGPTGSGKEALARAIHDASRRACQPFVAINCAAIPESLIESELFGYAAGAFTGARREGMRGRIVQASGGTLFLDEIGDMPLSSQTRLLRVLESHEVTPLGTERSVHVDLHVIAATHRNLRTMLADGEFREDLFYRLNGMTFELPALAQRHDKEALIRRCIAEQAGGNEPITIEPAALDALLAFTWPGNIRELRNTVRTVLAICDERHIRRDDLPAELRVRPPTPATVVAASTGVAAAPTRSADSLETAERQALLTVIRRNGWNMPQAAAELKLSRNTLYRKLRQHGIAVGTERFSES
jgi:transcriptional regulator of acetoin/glycerol metabolism